VSATAVGWRDISTFAMVMMMVVVVVTLRSVSMRVSARFTLA
jgi:hypothetical protein